MSDPHFLEQEALERLLGDRELLKELIESFLRSAPPIIAQIEEAVTSGNTAQIDFQAHTLKSALSSLGASHAAELAYSLERMGKERNLSFAADTMKALICEVVQLFKELEEYRRRAA